MSKTQLLAAFISCSVFAITTQAYDSDSRASQRAHIKALQVQLQQNEVAVIRHQRELRQAIRMASRDL